MHNNPLAAPTPPIVYPDSDGKPMAENTLQAEWIVVLFTNLSARFADRPDVFVAADNLWYPVEGRPDLRLAPDVYLVFGRPKGHRGSYRQWEEDDIPLTVAIEVLSPGNTPQEMRGKLLFYEEYGVEEYYVYDPDRKYLEVYLRQGSVLRRVWDVPSFVSPRLGIRFDLSGPDLVVYHPDGEAFRTFIEVRDERDQQTRRANAEARRAEMEHQRAAEATHRAEEERQRAGEAARQADAERQRADEAARRAERLAARLRELGIDPDA